MKQWKPGTEPLTVEETTALGKRDEKRKDAARFVGVLLIAILFLYAVLFGAVKVIKFAGG